MYAVLAGYEIVNLEAKSLSNYTYSLVNVSDTSLIITLFLKLNNFHSAVRLTALKITFAGKFFAKLMPLVIYIDLAVTVESTLKNTLPVEIVTLSNNTESTLR